MTFYLSGQVPNTRTGGVRRGLCFLLALAAARVPAAVPQPSDPAAPPEAAFRYPVVTAPVMLQAPEVDGRVDTAEWASAAQVAGLHILDGTTAIEDPACWWVGRTADALHLAFRFDRPPHTAAAPAVSEAQLRLGDFCEVFLRPPGKDCDYVFLVNPAGMGQAALRTIRTGHRTTTWSHAARETATGWEGELSIPFASLEEAPPAPGTSWKMSLTRNQKAPEKEVGVSSWIANWRSLDEGVDLRFGEPAAPAVRLLEAGPLTPAEAGLLLEVAAPRASARVTIACTLLRQTRAMTEQVSTHIGEMLLPDVREMSVFWIMDARGLDAALAYYEPVASWMQELEVAAGQAARLPLAAATEPGDYLLTWLVRDTASGQLLLGGALPFAQQPPLNVAVQQWLLVAQCLAVEAEYRRAVNLPPGTQLVAELLDPAGETVLARAETAADLTRRRSLLRLPAVDRWGQRLRVRTTMRGPAGQILNEVSTDLQLPDHPPEWYPNEIGITDEVLPRWTPIRLGTAADPAGTPVETASVVLRDYHLRPSGLPARILSRDEELLSGPIELTLAGAPLDWTRALLEQKPGKVVWEARATREALALTLRTTLEFDGMIRYDLTLTPAETTRINDLALSIPYRAAVNIEPLQSWDRFEPMVMLGDFERGLCWFCESARGWKLGPRPAIEQTLTGETIDWQIRFIAGEGREISEPLSFTWGLQALPVREMDNTYQYTERRLTHGHPDMARTLLEEPELTETALRYPLEGNLPVEQGALRFHWIYNNLGRGTIPLLRLGAGPETLEIQFGTVRELGRGFTLALTQGGQRLIQLHPIYRSVETPWTPVGLSWRRQGESMQLILATAKPNGQAQYATATLPAAAWQSALAQGELTFGGAGTIALDDLVVSRAFLDGPALVAAFTQPAAVNPDTTLVDPFDSLRFYRANYLTQPLQIATGRGGVAGAALYGGFVRRLPGRTGKALVLPSAEPRTVLDWAKSLGATHGVYHEQYHVRHGHYEPPYAPDPLWAESLQEGLRNGWGMAFYDGFGHHRQYDTRIGPFMDELRLMPESVIGYPNSPSPAPGMSRAAADYKVWGWKQAIDEYGV
ncbi:MAG: DUF6067 family protein, partial [Candidatus Marinimicrobia bacterium]|nr:DUF6067 family protein [Candidatus Neomarinimicrobiota bacterium]